MTLATVSTLVLIAIVAAISPLLAECTGRLAILRFLRRHLHSSAQLPIRIAVVLIASLALLAFKLGLSVLLGAFAAGIIYSGPGSQRKRLGWGFIPSAVRPRLC